MYAKGLHLVEPPPGLLGFNAVLQGKEIPVQRFYKTGAILNQGDKPHCGGYAACQLLQSEPVPQRPLSGEAIYKKAKTLDNMPPGTGGTTIFGVTKALAELGLIKDQFFAYNAAQIFDYIASTSPVIVGSHWFEGMDNPNGSGQVKAKGGNTGGHAYLAHGVDFLSKRIYFTNSWGREWGKDGTFWMSFKEFTRAFDNRGMVAAAVHEIKAK